MGISRLSMDGMNLDTWVMRIVPYDYLVGLVLCFGEEVFELGWSTGE